MHDLLDEIMRIKHIWIPSYWDIKDENKLCEWMLSDKAPLVLPGELMESARELKIKNVVMSARSFFLGRWQEAEWLEKAQFKRTLEPFSIEELFIIKAPDLIGGDLWQWLESEGVFDCKEAA